MVWILFLEKITIFYKAWMVVGWWKQKVSWYLVLVTNCWEISEIISHNEDDCFFLSMIHLGLQQSLHTTAKQLFQTLLSLLIKSFYVFLISRHQHWETVIFMWPLLVIFCGLKLDNLDSLQQMVTLSSLLLSSKS